MVRILLSALLAFGLTQSGVAHAQSLFGSSGSSGSSGMSTGSSSGGSRGGTSSSGISSGSSMMGGSTGSSTGSRSSSGSGNSSQSGQGAGIQSSLNTGYGTVGAKIGQSAFTGMGTNAAFVGNQNATQRRSNSASQMFSQLQNLANQNRNNNTSNTVQQRMRPTLQLGFAPAAIDSTALQSTLQTNLASIPQLGDRAQNVRSVADSTGVVTLTGTVANEDDRRMMELVMRLEPGVREIRNELKVAP